MRSDSNYDLLEMFQNITIGDDDKPSYLGEEEWLKKKFWKNVKETQDNRIVLNKEKEEGKKNVEACVK